MKSGLSLQVGKLQTVLNRFDQADILLKQQQLKSIAKQKLIANKSLVHLQDCLLFLLAYPDSSETYNFITPILAKIEALLRKPRHAQSADMYDSALPNTKMIARFSHDLFLWLQQNAYCDLNLDSFDDNAKPLHEVLRLTMPNIEREYFSLGLDNLAMLDYLGVRAQNRFEFLLSELAKLNDRPFLKDYLWNELQLYADITLKGELNCKTNNRLVWREVYFHKNLLRTFDHQALIAKALPKAKKLTEIAQNELVRVIRFSLLHTMRETDPSTYLDAKTLRFYELERGISIALYGMEAKRQMALQSYVGYTLFKNGMPMAYGGAWIFGPTAMFGLNIFDSYRGGESGYVMCQLLRVYKQVFSLNYIEVEAYQFGKDNPDGIRSGAYWFYYRYGFRSIDSSLRNLAEKEAAKVSKRQSYRSAEKTLIQLAESNMCLSFNAGSPLKVFDVMEQISEMINKQYAGFRSVAETACVEQFCKNLRLRNYVLQQYSSVIGEVAFLYAIVPVKNELTNKLFKKLLASKANDPYRYNQLLHHVIGYLK